MRRFHLGMLMVTLISAGIAGPAHAQVGGARNQQSARGGMGHCKMGGGGMSNMGMQNPMMSNMMGMQNPMMSNMMGMQNPMMSSGYGMPFGGANVSGMQQPMSYQDMLAMQQMMYQMMLMQQMQNNPYAQGLNNNTTAFGLQRQRNTTTGQGATQTAAFRQPGALRR